MKFILDNSKGSSIKQYLTCIVYIFWLLFRSRCNQFSLSVFYGRISSLSLCLTWWQPCPGRALGMAPFTQTWHVSLNGVIINIPVRKVWNGHDLIISVSIDTLSMNPCFYVCKILMWTMIFNSLMWWETL